MASLKDTIEGRHSLSPSIKPLIDQLVITKRINFLDSLHQDLVQDPSKLVYECDRGRLESATLKRAWLVEVRCFFMDSLLIFPDKDVKELLTLEGLEISQKRIADAIGFSFRTEKAEPGPVLARKDKLQLMYALWNTSSCRIRGRSSPDFTKPNEETYSETLCMNDDVNSITGLNIGSKLLMRIVNIDSIDDNLDENA
ncbi:unnamed protein product [Lepeophtheirus salmonis]|uniref:(salmon louse) hypothetical protein n=1 Tax=Lepeophtheirus salmonis TaxID=72036 RepID=A0A817FDH5_LEPSM|nr:unnamed protein product [Lepeophtheirus salmonis]